jgi:hypothetical protein
MNKRGEVVLVVALAIICFFAVFFAASAGTVQKKPATVKNVMIDNTPLVPLDNVGGREGK